MKCPNCGEIIKDTKKNKMNFCGFCGTNLRTGEKSWAVRENEKNENESRTSGIPLSNTAPSAPAYNNVSNSSQRYNSSAAAIAANYNNTPTEEQKKVQYSGSNTTFENLNSPKIPEFKRPDPYKQNISNDPPFQQYISYNQIKNMADKVDIEKIDQSQTIVPPSFDNSVPKSITPPPSFGNGFDSVSTQNNHTESVVLNDESTAELNKDIADKIKTLENTSFGINAAEQKTSSELKFEETPITYTQYRKGNGLSDISNSETINSAQDIQQVNNLNDNNIFDYSKESYKSINTISDNDASISDSNAVDQILNSIPEAASSFHSIPTAQTDSYMSTPEPEPEPQMPEPEPEKDKIINFIGQERTAAENMLRFKGVTTEIVYVTDEKEYDTVIGQSVDPDTEFIKGSPMSITLTVSGGTWSEWSSTPEYVPASTYITETKKEYRTRTRTRSIDKRETTNSSEYEDYNLVRTENKYSEWKVDQYFTSENIPVDDKVEIVARQSGFKYAGWFNPMNMTSISFSTPDVANFFNSNLYNVKWTYDEVISEQNVKPDVKNWRLANDNMTRTPAGDSTTSNIFFSSHVVNGKSYAMKFGSAETEWFMYRRRELIETLYFYEKEIISDWSEWGEWTEQEPTASEDCEIDERTLSRSRRKVTADK